MYKFVKNKKLWWITSLAGLISALYGISSTFVFSVEENTNETLNGMLSGLGSVLFIIGVVLFIRDKFISDEKRKLEEIEAGDERNQQIIGKICIVGTITAILCFSVMAFLFVAIEYRIPSYISIGAMYVMLFSLSIAKMVYTKKM